MGYVNRKQINLQLKKALKIPFVYAYGVEDSGKACAIRHYLKNEKQLNYQWFRLGEEVNKVNLWEKVFNKLIVRSTLDKEMKAYPFSEQDRKRYAASFEKSLQLPFVLVFEGGDEAILQELIDLYWELSMKGKGKLKVIFINTRPPGKKITAMIQKGSCAVLKQKIFLFQEAEIEKFYSLQKESFTKEDVKLCLTISGGWVAMMKQVGIKQMVNVPINEIRDLMEQILQENFSTKQMTSLLKICFLDMFELDQVYYLTKDKSLTIKIISLVEGNLMFQESEGVETYRLLPPFKKLLVQKLNASRINMNVLQQNQLQWLIQKKKYLDALEFAYKLNDIKSILTILTRYPNPMYYDLKPDMMKAIYEILPQEQLLQNIYVYMQVMEDYLLLINPPAGYKMLLYLEEYIQTHELSEDKKMIAGELELIKGYVAYNNLYEMCTHFKRAYELISPSVSRLSSPDMVISYGSPHVLYLYLTKAGNAKRLLTFIAKEIDYYTDITQGLNIGLELQSQAEYELETGNYTDAMINAEKAYHKAFMYQIRYMCVCSLFTIGRASILTYDDYNYTKVIHLLYNEKKATINVFLKKEIESAMAYLLSLKPIENKKLQYVLDPSIETQIMDAAHHSFSYIAQGQIFIHENEYRQLYTLSQKMHMFYQNAKHVFGEIYTELYESISLYYLGKKKEALTHMQNALNICAKDHFTTPFVEQGTLVLEIIKNLKKTKQIALIEKEIQAYTKYKVFHFTEKEVQVFTLHEKGYSRQAIAEEMNTTLYAVKYYLQNIKKKTSNRRVSAIFDDTD